LDPSQQTIEVTVERAPAESDPNSVAPKRNYTLRKTSPPDLVLGIDASTTTVKAIAWDRHGEPVAEGRSAVSLARPHPAWHEQPAQEWWQAFIRAVGEVLQRVAPQRLAALCIAHQRETFVVVDEAGLPLRPGIVWMDERARPLLPGLEAIYGREHFHRLTGKPFSGNLLPGKLAWLREHEPQTYQRIHKVLDVQAYLVHHLTGYYRTSLASADPMGLIDMPRETWAQEVLREVGLSTEHMPELYPTGAWIGEVSPQAAEACGLPPSLPLLAGLGDGQSGGLGANITQPGAAYLNLGTAVVSGTVTGRYLVQRAFRTHYAGVPKSYSLETVILGGTYTHRWFVDFANQLSPERDWDEGQLDVLAAQVAPGAAGLLLVPYWNTALNPYWDAGASGITMGWRGGHGAAHFYRAILEGIAFEQRLATEGVEAALGEPVRGYMAFGGGARSRLWPQIIADVTGKPVCLAHAPEATALGAGILAAAGVGFYPDVGQAAQVMTRRQSTVDGLPERFEPDEKRQAIYDRLYGEVYQHIFPALQPLLNRLAELTEQGDTLEVG
jgi:xylulokinase